MKTHTFIVRAFGYRLRVVWRLPSFVRFARAPVGVLLGVAIVAAARLALP